MRIVSLLASGTELVCALGAGDDLVGRSHECDDPPWVTRLPAVSSPTFHTGGSSCDIDRRVRQKLASGEPLYWIDEEQISRLAPDVVITQTHCEVCAVSDTQSCEIPTLSRRPAVALRTGTLEGILEGFQEVAAIIGRTEAGLRLVADKRAHVARFRKAVVDLRPVPVVCLEWIEPPFVLGNWGPELVRLGGGAPLLGATGERSTATGWQGVRDADPEALIIAPCGFALDRTAREMDRLEAQPGWRDLRAVRDGRVVIADGNRFFNRSGPGVFETIDLLAEILHPDRFPPLHEGVAWQRWR